MGLILGKHIPDRFRETVLKGLGLITLVIGLQMALNTGNVLILLGSILLGGLMGEALNIQRLLDRAGSLLQAKFSGSARAGSAKDSSRPASSSVSAP